VAVIAKKCTDKGIALKVKTDSDLPQTVVGDPVKLRQILVNLLSNAVKFTDEGTIAIQVRKGGEPALGKGDRHLPVILSVSDTGVGIPADRQEIIFDSFEQGDTSFTRKYGGTGLGLAICRHLVQHMDGTLTVESTEGEGSRFDVTLPLDIHNGLHADTNGKTASVAAAGPAAFRSTCTGRVLVAEDNPVNMLVIRSHLQKMGFQVVEVQTGRDALERTETEPFDLIFMDIHMPEMDGFEATRAIRSAQGPGRHTPIVALTADAMDQDRDRCLAAGMDHYLSKPFTPDQLAEAVGRFGLCLSNRT
jgi:CheY-like chemotaxis protein